MVKIVKNAGNGRLNNLNDPDRPQCVKHVLYINSSQWWPHHFPGGWTQASYGRGTGLVPGHFIYTSVLLGQFLIRLVLFTPDSISATTLLINLNVTVINWRNG